MTATPPTEELPSAMIEAGGLVFGEKHSNCCYPQAMDFEANLAAEAIYLAMRPHDPELIELRAKVETMRAALERTDRNFDILLRGGPVRDVAEMKAETRAALSERK